MKTLSDLLKSKRTVKIVKGTDQNGLIKEVPVMGLIPSKKKNRNGISEYDTLIGLSNEVVMIVPVSSFDIQNYPYIIVENEIFEKHKNY